MIASVSTFSRSSGATSPVWTLNFSMSASPANVDEVPGDRRRRRHLGAHEMRAPPRALPAFEVSIGCRRAALARGELVVVHAQAHRAARVAPLEAGVEEYAV